MKPFLFLVLLCLFSAAVTAATRTWTGAGAGGAGTDFNSSSNWTGSGALLSSDNLVVTLTSNSTVTLSLSANLSVNKLTITGSVSNIGSGGRAFTLNTGNFTLSSSGDFTITNSSRPSGFQTSRPYDMAVSVSSSGSLTIGGNLACTNTDISFSDNSISFSISGSMTVTGTTLAKSLNSSTAAFIHFAVGNSPAKITFTGNTTLDDNTGEFGNAIYIGSTASGSTGSFVFNADLSLGFIACTSTIFTAATVLFDGTGTQILTYGNTDAFFRIPFAVIGSSNNPTVTVANANSVIPDNITQDLTVNGSSVLNLNSLQLNRKTNGGIFSLKNTAQLKLSATSSVLNSGSATLISGSNFPSGFTTVTLDSTSTVEFNGAGQTIPLPTSATVYGNLSLSGSGTKTLGNNISMYRALSVSGTAMALSTFSCTLISNVQTTAYILPVSGTPFTYGSGGGFVVERYMQAKTAWRFVSAPVTSGSSPTVFSSWQESGSFVSSGFGTMVTGPSGSGLDAVSNGYSMKAYDMTTDAYIPVTNTGNAIANTTGYMVYVRGDRSIAPGGTANVTNLRIKGQVNTGNQVFSVSANKYQSAGNPYPSRIDFRNVTKTSIVNAFIIWNPNTAGSYNVGGYDTYTFDGTNYKNTSGTIRNYIESGEAFFIQSTTGGSMTVTESSKTTGSSNVSFTAGAADPSFHLDLYAPDPAGNYLTDGVQVNVQDDYSNAVDNEDVKKLMNTADNLAIRKGNDKLVVEKHALFSINDTIFLSLTGTRVGHYQFKTPGTDLHFPALTAVLKDRFTGTEIPLPLNEETITGFDITSDPQSKIADRFYIFFRPAAVVPVRFISVFANRLSNGNAALQWKTGNEINIDHYEWQRSDDGINFSTPVPNNQSALNSLNGNATYDCIDKTAPAGDLYYRVTAKKLNGEQVFSDIAKLNSIGKQQGFTVYPNPVTGGELNILFQHKPAGRYDLQLVDMTGKIVSAFLINTSAADEWRMIRLPAGLSSGSYQLLISSGNEKETIKLVIR